MGWRFADGWQLHSQHFTTRGPATHVQHRVGQLNCVGFNLLSRWIRFWA